MGRKSPQHSLNGADWSGFVEKGVQLDGKFFFPGTFRIDGELHGTMESEQSLVIGENGRVQAVFHGNEITIEGHFEGDIVAKGRVEILRGGVVTGSIETPCLVIQPGGIFDGECRMLSSGAPESRKIAIPIRPAARA